MSQRQWQPSSRRKPRGASNPTRASPWRLPGRRASSRRPAKPTSGAGGSATMPGSSPWSRRCWPRRCTISRRGTRWAAIRRRARSFRSSAPPAGLSPAGARYLREYGLDDRGFAAALVGLAVKKHLKIKDEDGEFAITPLNRSGGGDPLTPAEGALFKALPSGELKLKQSNHQMVRNARSVLKDALEAEYEGSAFVRNIGCLREGCDHLGRGPGPWRAPHAAGRWLRRALRSSAG